MAPVAEKEIIESEENKEEDDSSSKPLVGIIYPPPEVRNIVDKTASFVARNGPEFETRIRQNEVNNPKFNFLNPSDPYHAYYRHKVNEFKEGKSAESQSAVPPAIPTKITEKPSLTAIPTLSKPTPVVETIVLKDPPQDYEFVADPPSISAFDLDVVRLTAQFVARNGRQFLTSLMNKEHRNIQFDFLRPQHSLFQYFTKLVEQYTKVLIPPKDLLNKLKKDSSDSKQLMDQILYRVEWAKHQEREKKKEEEEKERERVAYAQIDWHDFVVVETVDYMHGEQGNFPEPTTPEQLGARLLAEERFEMYGDGEAEDVEMEVESEGEDEEGDKDQETVGDEKNQEKKKAKPAVPPPQPKTTMKRPPLPPQPDNVEIRRDYNPKAPKSIVQTGDEYLISPLTGDKIPADKMKEHMRIGLLDPRWIEMRDRTIREKHEQEQVYAPGVSIGSSLKQLAERRTDIFGEGDVETVIGKKIGEEEERDTKQREKMAWDGHSASMEATINKAKANITLKEQIEAIHKAKGLAPDDEKEKIGPAKPLFGHTDPRMMDRKELDMEGSASNKSASSGPPVPLLPLHPPSQPPLPSQPQIMPMHPAPPRMMSQSVRAPHPPMPPSAPMRSPHGGNPGMQPSAAPGFYPPGQRPPLMPPMSILPPAAARRPLVPGGEPMPLLEQPPPIKKQKTAEEQLVSEEVFITKNPGPVTFKVQVPTIPDKPEWKLGGQSLTFTLPLKDQVSVIKAKLFEELGIPTGKQKLQLEGMFIKDSNSLGFYNMTTKSVIQLQLKERGGRRK